MAQSSDHRSPGTSQNTSLSTRLSATLYRRPLLALALLLGPPLLWLGLVYLGSLLALLVQGFFYIDDYTGQVVRKLSLRSYAQLLQPANLDIFLRTSAMALAVTLAAAMLAFPLAYYMARYAPGRVRGLLYLGVILPLWSSYIVRVYSWKLILAKEGIISWVVSHVGAGGLLERILALPLIGGPSLSFSALGMFLVFLYIWLPYMVLPIQAALERVPRSLLEASADLGARPSRTFRSVVLPLAFPGVVAGSIFTFSLTLGDFIIPGTIGNSSLFIGQAVLRQQGTAGNVPLAAAMTVVPMLIMAVYLWGARRLGAFDAL
ncbi:MAG: ABC transporter permease [Acidobacteriota bacterium]